MNSTLDPAPHPTYVFNATRPYPGQLCAGAYLHARGSRLRRVTLHNADCKREPVAWHHYCGNVSRAEARQAARLCDEALQEQVRAAQDLRITARFRFVGPRRPQPGSQERAAGVFSLMSLRPEGFKGCTLRSEGIMVRTSRDPRKLPRGLVCKINGDLRHTKCVTQGQLAFNPEGSPVGEFPAGKQPSFQGPHDNLPEITTW